ncbi:MAG: T9SS type A sorting domain-containing protein [Bacteroidota bacterium]
MKKLSLIISIFLMSNLYSHAQSFSLEWEGEILGDTITLVPNSGISTEIVFDAIFHNKTNDEVEIKVARNDVFIIEGSSNYFCWVACYPPSVDTSGVSKVIPGGGYTLEGEFSGHYSINSTFGISLVEYTFFNVENFDDNIKIVVKYDTFTTDIDDNIFDKVWISDAYPNPATTYFSIDYKLPVDVVNASVKVVNLLGSTVKDQEINIHNSSLKMDMSDMKSGIYFYSLIVNGEIYSTEKLIIR